MCAIYTGVIVFGKHPKMPVVSPLCASEISSNIELMSLNVCVCEGPFKGIPNRSHNYIFTISSFAATYILVMYINLLVIATSGGM